MEAIGQLTGGVAHDFNNILAAILANSYFLIEALDEGDPRRKDAEEIKNCGERAARLTRQLLAFSRRQILQPVVLDLDAVVRGLEPMLRRLIGADVELSIDAGEKLGSVRADPGQIEQVIMNLIVNARDAMPDGGEISLETTSIDLDETYVASNVVVPPGRYVVLSVSDTGCGMDAETQRRAFEPFFTTKGKERGTGLGLSTSYGIIQQSGGYISLSSELGIGTVFRIYLPRCDARPEGSPFVSMRCGDCGGTETILLIEDDDAVRAAVIRMLSPLGYRVLAARDGHEAFALLKSEDFLVDLILSDIIVPGVNGPEIARTIRRQGTIAKELFMSGYTDHAAFHNGALPDGMNFIQKPFTPSALAAKVREALDA